MRLGSAHTTECTIAEQSIQLVNRFVRNFHGSVIGQVHYGEKSGLEAIARSTHESEKPKHGTWRVSVQARIQNTETYHMHTPRHYKLRRWTFTLTKQAIYAIISNSSRFLHFPFFGLFPPFCIIIWLNIIIHLFARMYLSCIWRGKNEKIFVDC